MIGLGEGLHLGFEQAFLHFLDRWLLPFREGWGVADGAGSADAGIGEEQVDVALLLAHAVGDGLEGVFVRNVADDGDDVAIGRGFGGVLERFFL